MRITIVGAGNMGRGIGTRAVAGGHQVEIVDREPAEAEKLAAELGEQTTALDAGAPFGGEVVVFAVYYPGIKDAVRERRPARREGRRRHDETRRHADVGPAGDAAGSFVGRGGAGTPPAVNAGREGLSTPPSAGRWSPARSRARSSTCSSPATMSTRSRRSRSSSWRAASRCRTPRACAAARAARLPPHLAPAAPRARLRERDQAASLARRSP